LHQESPSYLIEHKQGQRRHRDLAESQQEQQGRDIPADHRGTKGSPIGMIGFGGRRNIGQYHQQVDEDGEHEGDVLEGDLLLGQLLDPSGLG